jgi:putative transposase
MQRCTHMNLHRDDPLDAEDETWAVAHQRATVIRKIVLIEDESRRAAAIRAAAAELGVSRAGFYRMVARFRAVGTTSALLPSRLGRRTGTWSLDARREELISREIETFYLRPERPQLSQLIERIAQRCNAAGLKAPNWRTVHARVSALDAKLAAAKRHDVMVLKDLLATPGELVAPRPLDIVQIDHTPVDVMVVDAETRQGTTRPWLTLAIDVHTRMVVGYHLSLLAPSVISVGLCLLNAIFDKTALMADMGLDVTWPTIGMPQEILVDNGPEFHGKAFLRGCEEHGITVDWRPPGAPRYGGHIERLIGTHMNAVHVIAGSTGSSVSDRQGRDAHGRASLTMRELERWLVLEIAGKYHHKVHATLQRPPIALWRELTGDIPLRLPPDRLKFWVAFLPEERRALRRDGVHLFGIRYWSPALAQDVGRADQPLTVRYDPRDISRVFVRRPNGSFVETRYRHLGYPPVSLWERNAAVRRLREKGRHEVDEAMIFASIAEQRVIEDEARLKSAKARRNRDRRPPARETEASPVKLRDIDTGVPSPALKDGGAWDEP